MNGSTLPDKYGAHLLEEYVGLEMGKIFALATLVRALSPHLTPKQVFEKLNDADYLFAIVEAIEEVLDEERPGPEERGEEILPRV